MIAIVTNNYQEYLGYLEIHKLSQKDCLFVNRAEVIIGRHFNEVVYLYHAEDIPRKEMTQIIEYLESHTIKSPGKRE